MRTFEFQCEVEANRLLRKALKHNAKRLEEYCLGILACLQADQDI